MGIALGAWKTLSSRAMNSQVSGRIGMPKASELRVQAGEEIWPQCSVFQTCSLYPVKLSLGAGLWQACLSMSLLALADSGHVQTERGKQARCLILNGLLLGS